MTKRRAYTPQSNAALKVSSLGPKRRTDGMSKLLARAGKGLLYQLPKRKGLEECESDNEEDKEEEEEEEEKPFEPLCVWKSPYNGGERVGLPMTMYVLFCNWFVFVLNCWRKASFLLFL